MSRRSRRDRRHARQSEADIFTRPGASSLSRLTTLTVRLPRPVVAAAPRDLRRVEDRRRFHPAKSLRSPRGVHGGPARLTARTEPSRPGRLPYAVNFLVPKKTVVCIRRQRRKEVLFAKRKAGKRGQRRSRRNFFSEVRCK